MQSRLASAPRPFSPERTPSFSRGWWVSIILAYILPKGKAEGPETFQDVFKVIQQVVGSRFSCQPVETERSRDTISRKILLHFSARQMQSTKWSKSPGLPGVWDKAQKLGVLTLLCDSAQATSPLSLCVLHLLITLPSVPVGISYQ